MNLKSWLFRNSTISVHGKYRSPVAGDLLCPDDDDVRSPEMAIRSFPGDFAVRYSLFSEFPKYGSVICPDEDDYWMGDDRLPSLLTVAGDNGAEVSVDGHEGMHVPDTKQYLPGELSVKVN